MICPRSVSWLVLWLRIKPGSLTFAPVFFAQHCGTSGSRLCLLLETKEEHARNPHGWYNSSVTSALGCKQSSPPHEHGWPSKGDQVAPAGTDWPHPLAWLFRSVRGPQSKGILPGGVQFHLRLFLESLGMFAVVLKVCSLDQQHQYPLGTY